MALFDSITPRDDVLSGGELTEARFAASLEEVVASTAPDRQLPDRRLH
jgi:hypothetical protein